MIRSGIAGIAGIRAGVWEFVFFVNGDVRFVESVRVTPSPVPVHDVVITNATGQDVCYLYFAPLGASDTGLDELGRTEILPNGDFVVRSIPEGDIILDAYTCDFDLLFGEFDGLTVTAGTEIVLG